MLNTPEQDSAPGVWKSGPTANESVMMQVPNVGPFVRALLPVRLSGGYTVTFGVWVGISPDDLQRTFKVWWTPEYDHLTLDGRLANALPGWGLLASPVALAVRDSDKTPYCVASDNPDLQRVLTEDWPHNDVLDRLPN